MPNINTVNVNTYNQVTKPDDVQPSLGADHTTMNSNDFLKLFLEQLKVQDPLKPFDTNDMSAQMAQLTSITATEDMQKTIKGLNSTINRSQVLVASQLIGRKVEVLCDKSPLIEGEGLQGAVFAPGASQDVTITIKNSNGEVVHTIHETAAGPGSIDFKWDGKDDSGNPLKADYYKISATAVIDGKTQDIRTAGAFKVNSVAMQGDNSLVINVDGIGGTGLDTIIKVL